MIKNKIFLFIFIIFSFLFLLIGCSNNSKDVDEKSSEPVQEIEVQNDIVLKGTFLEDYKDIDAQDINKFLGTAIVNVRPEEYRKNDIPVISDKSPNADLVFTLMHLKPEMLETYAISTSASNSRAYCVAIIKPYVEYSEQVMVSISERIEDLLKNVKDYPDQLYVVENHKMQQVGDYIVLVICENSDKVFEELVKVMENTDLTTLNSVPMFTDDERDKFYQDALNKELEEIESEIGEVTVTPVEEGSVVENFESTENNVNNIGVIES